MKHENINTFVAVVGLLIALGSFGYDYIQDKRISNINYKVVATENRPLLIISDEPDIVLAELFMPYEVEDMIGKRYKLKNEIFIGFRNFKLNVKFKNIGNNTAHVIAEVQADQYKGEFVLRDIFMGKLDDVDINSLPWNDFFKTNQILPDKDRLFEFTSEAKNVKDNKFIRHVMLLYQNDVDMFFDTYCWISIGIDIKDSYAKNEKHNYNGVATIRADNKVVGKQYIGMDVLDVKCDYKIYSDEEAETVSEEVRRLCIDCKKKKAS